MVRVELVLRQYDVNLRPEQFKELVVSIAQQVAPSWTDEKITGNPDVAIQVCAEVRRRVNCPSLPHEVILRSLTNVRRKRVANHG